MLIQAEVGGARWHLATIREENDRGERIERERLATRLGPDEYQVYRRYLAAVFSDPLDRFAAAGT